MNKIASSICFLGAAMLYAVDQMTLGLLYVSITNLGMTTNLGYINSIYTIILAVVLVLVGVYFLVKS